MTWRTSLVAAVLAVVALGGCGVDLPDDVAAPTTTEGPTTTAPPIISLPTIVPPVTGTTDPPRTTTTEGPSTTLSPDGVHTYTDPSTTFSIVVPNRWLVSDRHPAGIVQAWFLDTDPALRSNVNLIVQNVGAMTPEEYERLSESQIEQLHGTVVHHEALTFKDGSPGLQLETTLTYQGVTVHALSYALFTDGKVVLATFTSTVDNFERRRAEADTAMRSMLALH